MSKNTDRLCAALTGQMTRSAKGNQTRFLELGTINRRKELIPDSLRKPIPYGQYLYNRQAGFQEEPDSAEEDRVLVAWVGNEAIAVCPVHIVRSQGAISEQQIDNMMEGW